MSKLEPTRTSSDLTAAEHLRRLLDELGVEWAEYGDGYTLLRHGGREYTVQPNVCNRLIVTNLTPEQAIAATLGESPRLPHFWTHDGALHVEATRMPTRIVVCEGGTCEFVPKRELDASEAENAKLRRLVHRLISHVEHPPCEGCLAEMSCDGEHVTQCDEWLFMVADARKLGVEVDR